MDDFIAISLRLLIGAVTLMAFVGIVLLAVKFPYLFVAMAFIVVAYFVGAIILD